MNLLKALSLAAGFSLVVGLGIDSAEAAKKSRRDQMTEAQKKAARKHAREYCMKHYVKGTARLGNVYIQSNGKVICEVWS